MLICKNCEDSDIHILRFEASSDSGYEEGDDFIEGWTWNNPQHLRYQCRNCGHIWTGPINSEVENEEKSGN